MGISDILDMIPLIVGCVALVVSVHAYPKIRRKIDRIWVIIAVINTIIMMVAQMSWFVAAHLLGNLQDTSFANYLWTVFNTISMVLVLLFVLTRNRYIKWH